MPNDFTMLDDLIAEFKNLKLRVDELESRLRPSAWDQANSRESKSELLEQSTEIFARLIREHELLEKEIERRKRVETELTQKSELYQTLVETVKDVIWTVDLELRYTYLSPSVTKALGYSVEEMMAMNPLSGLTPSSRQRILTAYQEELGMEAGGTRGGNVSRTVEVDRYHKDGSIRWAEITTSFLRDSAGRPIGILGISHDITERKLMEEELLRIRYELEKRVQERTATLNDLNNKLRLEIEERKRADQSSRESEHTLKSILAASPVGISLSCDRQMKWCNDAWLSMFGFETEGECENLSAEDVYPSREEFERVGQILYDGLESGRVTEAEAAFRRKDASTFYGQIAMKALEPSDPSRGVIAVIRDVTDHRKAQDALRDGEIRYKSLYSMMRLMCDNVPDHIWAKDLEGRYLFVNRAICEGLLGAIDTHEPVGKSDLFFMDRERNSHQDNLDWHTFGEICVDSDQVVMRTKKLERFEESGNVMGELLCLDVYKAPFWNEQGEMIGTVGCGRDVTEEKQNDRQRKQAEESLRESEERYRRLVQLSPDGIGVHIGGRLLFANKSLADLLGVASPEQLIDRSITEFLHPDRRETGAARLDELHQGKPRKLIEEKLVRVDGTIIDVEVAAVRVSYQAKAAVQIVLRDITTRLRLKEAQRRLATAVEQAADAVVIADHLGNVQYVNPGFGLMTGYSREEVTGKTLGFLENDEHDRASWESMLDSVVKGEVWQGRVVGKRKDAGPLHAILTISPVRDTDGEIRNFVGVAHDITRQMLLERQLLQAQKMEAIGTLTGGIAHDFNNLLQVIQGYSDLLLDEKPEDHPERADLLKIFQAAKNGAQLVQRLLTYSRKVEPKPIPLNLNRQIVQVEKLLRRTIPKMIEIEMDLAGALAEINADPIQIEQVLMNLAVNARDAMPEGGKLNLQTRNVFLDDEYCGLHVGSRTGQYVLLVVSDTGHGIDEATIEHIFEPFYTTKEPGRGTGLGLAMVYGIVKQHGGYITCESEVRVGTVFHVYFPQIQATPETQAPVTDIPYMGGTETILLVDDEAVVRELGERFLTNAGYFVITAENGEVALEVFKEKGEQIALVLLDLFMPKLGGKECLRKLLRIDPRVKILVASGYPADASIRESFDSGARGFVTKPFGFKELLQQVRKVLDED